ncbi:DNA helicase/exodeoxyribonuclease V alpha subunit [Nicoletella semolina]|uniref:RecBCD enzyme subunit RecD n=1 Tax=Nicoletella semolina TaxID=271160 RepID=A0A4R2ND24_9PAST|nr:exodeoxyribonuclease V subunit alpha [Nicoletella semolina]MDH2924149.1 exodeoxyribonuclease V subunit alpha [Nicoletella semolina]TCP18955.1 DNA helicase/exodeoxyribonuclease V alpha subunit [Nicoletella semolina]
MLQLISELRNKQLIPELSYQFARLIDNKQKSYHYSALEQNLAILLAALCSFNVLQGNVCLRLDSALIKHLFHLQNVSSEDTLLKALLQKIEYSSPLEWATILNNHIAFSHTPERIAPMLFQHNSVYFYRYWKAEYQIASYLQQAVSFSSEYANLAVDKAVLSTFFPTATNSIDWQHIAVATALTKPFSFISGGPGTGKTRTVTILLAALQLKQLKLNQAPLKIALAAPTGKAAARLKESVNNNLQQLNLAEELKQLVPVQATTLHSLLGIKPYSDTPHYTAKNPLLIDLLVLDEASMVDLFLFDKMLAALKPQTRLIMLGDKDQLASVEAGNIIGELGELISLGYSQSHGDYLFQTTSYQILSPNHNVPAICDALCHLRHSYRFNQHAGIGQLATLINHKQAVKSWQIFANPDYRDLALELYPSTTSFNDKKAWLEHCVQLVVQKAVSLYQHYLILVKQQQKMPQETTIDQIFSVFQQFRFLSALRVSELGVEQLNEKIAQALKQAQLVYFQHSRDSYAGKPILITENAPQLQVFSGDIALLLPDEDGRLRAYFETINNGCRLNILPSRLPSYEPAYVMTVHKSQGSEFAHTLLVMPLTPSPILTKELLYTAVTRAKKQFTLFSQERIWQQAVKQDIQRQSNLNTQIFVLEKKRQHN